MQGHQDELWDKTSWSDFWLLFIIYWEVTIGAASMISIGWSMEIFVHSPISGCG